MTSERRRNRNVLNGGGDANWDDYNQKKNPMNWLNCVKMSFDRDDASRGGDQGLCGFIWMLNYWQTLFNGGIMTGGFVDLNWASYEYHQIIWFQCVFWKFEVCNDLFYEAFLITTLVQTSIMAKHDGVLMFTFYIHLLTCDLLFSRVDHDLKYELKCLSNYAKLGIWEFIISVVIYSRFRVCAASSYHYFTLESYANETDVFRIK